MLVKFSRGNKIFKSLKADLQDLIDNQTTCGDSHAVLDPDYINRAVSGVDEQFNKAYTWAIITACTLGVEILGVAVFGVVQLMGGRCECRS